MQHNSPTVLAQQTLAAKAAAWEALAAAEGWPTRCIAWGFETIRLALAVSSDGSVDEDEVGKVWADCVRTAAGLRAKTDLQPDAGITAEDFQALFQTVMGWSYGKVKRGVEAKTPVLFTGDSKP